MGIFSLLRIGDVVLAGSGVIHGASGANTADACRHLQAESCVVVTWLRAGKRVSSIISYANMACANTC